MMKTISEIILLTFESEFKRLPNLIGWMLTANLWIITNIEQVSNIVTVLGGMASFIWIALKIAIAVKTLKKGKHDSDE